MFKRLKLTNALDIECVFELVKQLRKHLDFETFQKLLQKMELESYELWAYEVDGKIMGAMGLRSYTDFVRGTHLYVDDLVVDEKFRSQQIGSKLLQHAEALGKERGVPSLRLACAIENVGGLRFYEKEKWTKRSFNFVKKCNF